MFDFLSCLYAEELVGCFSEENGIFDAELSILEHGVLITEEHWHLVDEGLAVGGTLVSDVTGARGLWPDLNILGALYSVLGSVNCVLVALLGTVNSLDLNASDLVVDDLVLDADFLSLVCLWETSVLLDGSAEPDDFR